MQTVSSHMCHVLDRLTLLIRFVGSQPTNFFSLSYNGLYHGHIVVLAVDGSHVIHQTLSAIFDMDGEGSGNDDVLDIHSSLTLQNVGLLH
jgi:hypothetical protein